MRNDGKTKPYTEKKKTAPNVRILGVIPARGGSKGVPRKNIRPLAGKPLLYYMLTEALKSSRLSRVVVSSDDDEILAIAAMYGGQKVPLKRPKHLATDTAPDVPMLQHAVRAVEGEEGTPYDYVVQLHVTTPFVSSKDIDAALDQLLAKPEADSVVSVFSISDYHPIKLKKIVDDRLQQYVPEYDEKTTERRQDLDPVYKRNGGLYASKREVVMEQHRVFGDFCLPYVMPYELSFEVDKPVDFLIADYLMRHYKKHGTFDLS